MDALRVSAEGCLIEPYSPESQRPLRLVRRRKRKVDALEGMLAVHSVVRQTRDSHKGIGKTLQLTGGGSAVGATVSTNFASASEVSKV